METKANYLMIGGFVLGVLALGGCATKGDIESLRTEIAGLRSSIESVDAKATRAEAASQQAAADAARAAADALSGHRPARGDDDPPEPDGDGGADGAPGPLVFRELPTGINAELTPGRYVFPVYGPVGFGNSFGAARASTGWHHGEDIFAAAGSPLLAVADGTLHTIGFNRIGGYRLWLRDTEGDEFYYAHLSAYSPLAVEGRSVKAGDVIGFVGNTGDADGGAPHLHFEIHPASMGGLGYDGVVAPYSILLAWRRLQDISFSAGRIYVPTGQGGSTTLPPPGAVLLEADDIGSTSGLVPGALEKVLSK